MKRKNTSSKIVSLIHLLPRGKTASKVLRDRAERIAKQAIATAQRTDEESYVCFRLGREEQYGLPYPYAKEVMHNQIPTRLPHAPGYIAGVINRRGALIAVVDLKQLFHIQPADYQNPYILIVSGKKMTFGILADSILGSRAYDSKSLDAPLPSEGLIKPDYILGLHQARTALLNIDSIVSDLQTQLRGNF